MGGQCDPDDPGPARGNSLQVFGRFVATVGPAQSVALSAYTSGECLRTVQTVICTSIRRNRQPDFRKWLVNNAYWTARMN